LLENTYVQTCTVNEEKSRDFRGCYNLSTGYNFKVVQHAYKDHVSPGSSCAFQNLQYASLSCKVWYPTSEPVGCFYL